MQFRRHRRQLAALIQRRKLGICDDVTFEPFEDKPLIILCENPRPQPRRAAAQDPRFPPSAHAQRAFFRTVLARQQRDARAVDAPALAGQPLHRAEMTTGGIHRRQSGFHQSSQRGLSV